VATWSKVFTDTPRLKQFQLTQFQFEAILKGKTNEVAKYLKDVLKFFHERIKM